MGTWVLREQVNFRSLPKANFLYFSSGKPYGQLLAQKSQLSAGAEHCPLQSGIDVTVSPVPTLGKETQHILICWCNRSWDGTRQSMFSDSNLVSPARILSPQGTEEDVPHALGLTAHHDNSCHPTQPVKWQACLGYSKNAY